MSCCRGRRLASVQSADTGPCKIIEQGGATLKFWLANVGGSYELCMRDQTGRLIGVNSYLSTHRCSGPTARLLLSNVSRVAQAASKSPGAFLRYNSTGVSLIQLLRTADSVLSSGSAENVKRFSPFSSR